MDERNLLRELYIIDTLESRRETCEILRGMGYHIRLNKHLAFEAEYAEGWEELSEEELESLLQEAIEEENKGFIDDEEVLQEEEENI